MAQLILLRGAKQLLTLRGPNDVRRGAALRDLGIIEDGSVLIRDGIIAAVGSTRRLENLKEARDALEIPATGRVIMPGLIDASLTLSLDTTHAHSRRKMTNFYDESLALMRSCLQHGTLAADIKAWGDRTGFGSDVSVLRKLANIGSNPVRMTRTWRVSQPTVHSNTEAHTFDSTLEVLTRRKLIQYIELTQASEAALNLHSANGLRASGLGTKLLWNGGSAGELQAAISRLQPQTVCCLSPIDRQHAQVLSEAPGITVFTTGKNVFEGPVGASARQVVDSGGAVALSSGYDSATAATFSMQMSIALAVVRLGLTAEEAFTAATINAAHAAGCAHLTGSLEYGKQADLLLLNVDDYREMPLQFGINHVEMAIRQGNIVLNRSRWRANTH